MKGREAKIQYIVIHYTTSRTSAKGSALSSRSWFNNPIAISSAHYVVDDSSIIHIVEDEDTAWHCGAGDNGTYYCGCRNANSIGIEIASNHADKTTKNIPAEDRGWYFTEASLANAASLTIELMKKYDIPSDRVIRHYDVTHKVCPAPMVWDESQWVAFKKRIDKEVIELNWTNEELKKFVEDTVNNMGKDTKDRKTPEWAAKHIEHLKDAGVTDGKNMGCLATREQVVTMIDRNNEMLINQLNNHT